MGGFQPTVWFLALLLALAPGAAAAVPVDDARAMPTPVEPGYHAGTLSRPVDTRDFFSFDAPAGAVLQMEFWSGGDAHAILYDPGGAPYDAWSGNGVATSTPLVESGTWTLEVATSVFPSLHDLFLIAFGGSVRYDFEFALLDGAHVATSVARAEWHVLELAPASAGWLEGGAVMQLPRHLTQPESIMLALQVGGTNAAASSSTWIGSDVRVGEPVDVEVGGASVTIEQVGDVWLLSWRQSSASLPMRLVMYSAGAPVKSTAYFYGEMPLDSAAASGNDTVQWTAHGERGVQAPGVALREGAGTTLDVDHQFFGVFTTHGDDGWYETPAGARIEMGPTNPADALVGVGAGAWRFHVAAHHAFAHEAASYHLSGVLVAPLGVYR